MSDSDLIHSYGMPNQLNNANNGATTVTVAVVVAVHWPEDETSTRKAYIEVDLFTMHGSMLYRVPWPMYGDGSRNSLDWSTPRAATRDLHTGRPLTTNLKTGVIELEPGSSFRDLDGDLVLVTFLNNDRTAPVILAAGLNPAWYGTGHPARMHLPPNKKGHHAEPSGDARAIVNAGSTIMIDSAGNIVLDTSRLPPPGKKAPEFGVAGPHPSGTVYVQARSGQRIILFVDRKQDLESLGYDLNDDVRLEYTILESTRGLLPQERTIITIESGQITFSIPKDGSYRFEEDNSAPGQFASAEAVAAELAKIRADIQQLHQYALQPQANGKVYTGKAPSASVSADKIAVRNMRCPASKGEN